jgi:hypothetical protein
LTSRRPYAKSNPDVDADSRFPPLLSGDQTMRLFSSLPVVLLAGLLLLSACERRILPDSSYKPAKSKKQVQKEAQAEEAEAVAAIPKVKTIGEMRAWTTPGGASRVEGAMIALKDERVELLAKNGSIIAIPLDRLSPADQQYAKDTAAKAPAGKKPPEEEKP